MSSIYFIATNVPFKIGGQLILCRKYIRHPIQTLPTFVYMCVESPQNFCEGRSGCFFLYSSLMLNPHSCYFFAFLLVYYLYHCLFLIFIFRTFDSVVAQVKALRSLFLPSFNIFLNTFSQTLMKLIAAIRGNITKANSRIVKAQKSHTNLPLSPTIGVQHPREISSPQQRPSNYRSYNS